MKKMKKITGPITIHSNEETSTRKLSSKLKKKHGKYRESIGSLFCNGSTKLYEITITHKKYFSPEKIVIFTPSSTS
jgi:hypothetical protein